MLFGALGMTLVGIPPVGEALGAFSLPVGFLLAMIFGGLWASIAGFLKVRFGASEIVVTLMLNYIAVQAISYIIFYHLNDGLKMVYRSTRMRGYIINQQRLYTDIYSLTNIFLKMER